MNMTTHSAMSTLPPFLSEPETPLSHTTVFDALQKEFCPLLDPTFIAALLADVDFDRLSDQISTSDSTQPQRGTHKIPGQPQKKKKKNGGNHVKDASRLDPVVESSLKTLYETLKEIAIAAQAEVDAEAASAALFSGEEPDEDDPDADGAAASTGIHGGTSPRSNTMTTTTTTINTSKSTSNASENRKPEANSPSNSFLTYSRVTGLSSLDTASISHSSCSFPSSSSSPSSLSRSSHSSSPASLGSASPSGKHAFLFLQAALPQIPTHTLLKTLEKSRMQIPQSNNTAGQTLDSDGDTDMWALISTLLMSEDVREMNERGLTTISPSSSSWYSGEGESEDSANAIEREEEEEGWQYLDQLDEDEKLARELALEMEAEDRVQMYNKKDVEDEEWVTAKKYKAKAKPATAAKGRAKLKVRLNDIRQQQHVTRPRAQSSSTPSHGLVSPSLSDSLPLFLLPSLATYLSSLLPRGRSPSALLSSSVKDSEVTAATHIQNVFLNEPALRTRYAGRVYLAVRACLERVVGETVLASKEVGKAKVNGIQEDGIAEGKGGDDTPHKERRKARPLPPEDTPRPRPRKAKSRVRTATDRSKAAEHEPGGSDLGGTDDGRSGSSDGPKLEEDDQTLLFTLLDILLPEYALVEGAGVYVEVHQLLSDIELCIGVTCTGEDALDLAKLLCELYVSDADPMREAGTVMEMFGGNGGRRREGVSYAETVKGWGKARTGAPVARKQQAKPKEVAAAKETTAQEKEKHKPSLYQWQAVPTKKQTSSKAYRVLPHLPTYTRDVNGIKRKEDGLVWIQGMEVPGWEPEPGAQRKGKAAELKEAERDYRHRVRENVRRRDELLHAAARMYHRGAGGGEVLGRGRGSGKVRGGDVAWYFAERAREFQEAARRESVNATRAMVLRKQVVSGERDTVDLHGTTVREAVEIVLEMLEGRKRGRPLKIVTGRGSHSASGTSVLKPALRKRLTEEGWSVGAWDAGLVIR